MELFHGHAGPEFTQFSVGLVHFLLSLCFQSHTCGRSLRAFPFLSVAGRLPVAEQDAVDRHGRAPALPPRDPADPRLPPPLPLPSLLAVLPLEQTRE